jgi:nitroreductase
MKVNEAIAKRWSPRAFSDQAIEKQTLRKLLQEAGKAASCFNEQPWHFIVGLKGSETYQKIYDTLVPFNQDWAKTAPVLMLAVSVNQFKRNSNPNPHHRYDLGQAVGFLSLRAMQEEIYLHQMAGFDAELAKEKFKMADEAEAVAAIAMGHLGDVNQLNEDLKQQETPESPRKALDEFVFEGEWGIAF